MKNIHSQVRKKLPAHSVSVNTVDILKTHVQGFGKYEQLDRHDPVKAEGGGIVTSSG